MAITNKNKRYIEQVHTVKSGDQGAETGYILDAAGNATDKYNDTSDGDVDSAEAETFIKTDLGKVDEATVQITTNNPALVNGEHVELADAAPASPSDFESTADYVDGTVKITLVDPGSDANSPAELADDTSISSLRFTYNVFKG